ncbi:hypothetical protein [Nocardia africana]|uniref:Uncharacterized protein n=1 Tax=Nocardia africana TaxID=134964 RepID=A0A378WRL4_9NOCA|nr:hypothetical protein [Nocardia africana]MCC3313992.1 hypothetical protein [Nocardia africana]SUA43769.1 Uncharacterised protein [Nocardia africana]
MTENTANASDSTTKPAETVTPEPDRETRERAKKEADKLDKIYEPGARASVVVPGTDGMVAGTAFADSVDEQITENKPPDELRKDKDS